MRQDKTERVVVEYRYKGYSPLSPDNVGMAMETPYTLRHADVQLDKQANTTLADIRDALRDAGFAHKGASQVGKRGGRWDPLYREVWVRKVN